MGGRHSCENLQIDSTNISTFPLWRELPGRWICLGATGGWQPKIDPDGTVEELAVRLDEEISRSVGSLASYPTRLSAWCDSCSAVIVTAEGREPVPIAFWMLERTGDGWRVGGEFVTWGDLVSGCGDHRHDSATDDAVRFYRIGPVGPTKSESHGTWADVVEALPYFLVDGGPIPPRRALNEVLRLGVQDGGMSGGAEWPPHELSEVEYARMRSNLLGRPDSPFASVEVPDALEPGEADAFIERHPEAAGIAARYSNLAADTVRLWSAHKSVDVRIGVASRQDLPDDVVIALSSDAHPSVRAIAATRRR